MTMQQYPSNGGILMQDKCIYNAQPVILPMPDQTLNDDILFSTFNLHFCNHCCLGFGALYNSVKVSNKYILLCNHFSASQIPQAYHISFFLFVSGEGQQIAWKLRKGTILRHYSSPYEHCCRRYWFHLFYWLHLHPFQDIEWSHVSFPSPDYYSRELMSECLYLPATVFIKTFISETLLFSCLVIGRLVLQ